MDQITVSAAIVAIVKVIKDLVPGVAGVVTVLVAVVLGAVAGYYHVQATPDVLTGVVLGLTAVGAVSVADRAAKRD